MAKALEITDEERALLVEGLQMKSNFIQTGNIALSAEDVQQQIKSSPRLLHERADSRVKSLSIEQMRLIVRLDDLIKKLCQR